MYILCELNPKLPLITLVAWNYQRGVSCLLGSLCCQSSENPFIPECPFCLQMYPWRAAEDYSLSHYVLQHWKCFLLNPPTVSAPYLNAMWDVAVIGQGITRNWISVHLRNWRGFLRTLAIPVWSQYLRTKVKEISLRSRLLSMQFQRIICTLLPLMSNLAFIKRGEMLLSTMTLVSLIIYRTLSVVCMGSPGLINTGIFS